jgi:hypothetical protein
MQSQAPFKKTGKKLAQPYSISNQFPYLCRPFEKGTKKHLILLAKIHFQLRYGTS